MAYVSPQLDPNQQNQLAPTGATTANPSGLLPPQAGGSAGQGGAPDKGTPTQFGSQASNLSSYLSANAPTIQQQAQNISQQLGQQYGQVSGAINQAGQNFGQQVQAGTTPFNPDIAKQAEQNPAAFATKPENVSAFQKQLNAQYTGPQSFETSGPYADINSQVQGAVKNAGLWSTPEGIRTQIQGTEVNPTPGITTLDQLLLQMNPEAIGQVQTAAQPFQQLPGQLSNVATAQDQAIQAAQAQEPQAQQAAQKAISDSVANLNKQVQDELNKGTQSAQAYNQSIAPMQSAAANYRQSIQNYLNQHPQITDTSKALDPWAALSAVNAPTVGQTATPQDFATLSAISQLAGQPVQAAIQPGEVSQAGTFSVPTATMANVSGALNTELGNIGNQITNAYNPLQNLLQSENTRYNLVDQANKLTQQIQQLETQTATRQTSAQQAQIQALKDQYKQLVSNPNYQINNYWPQIGQEAQQLQWLPSAATDYNTMLGNLQSYLSGIPNVNVPNPPPASDGSNLPPELPGLLNMQLLGIPTQGIENLGKAIGSGLSDIGSFLGF